VGQDLRSISYGRVPSDPIVEVVFGGHLRRLRCEALDLVGRALAERILLDLAAGGPRRP